MREKRGGEGLYLPPFRRRGGVSEKEKTSKRGGEKGRERLCLLSGNQRQKKGPRGKGKGERFRVQLPLFHLPQKVVKEKKKKKKEGWEKKEERGHGGAPRFDAPRGKKGESAARPGGDPAAAEMEKRKKKPWEAPLTLQP